ncbi:sugar phosphate isomerase/epimerase family protein [Hoeflea sp. TYP-13]|uniref:sugar phosphate isomerase/epimerase family protein n=1 Tax=Hoeflea sp. TYP-13 TaxID=3230023 RepID=UPI0034C66220
MSKTDLPVIGAALNIMNVKLLKPWLFEKNRDVEIQDFVYPSVMDGDWQGIVSLYEQHFAGFEGRIGIHGPFFGLDLAATDPEIQNVIRNRMFQGLDICEALGATHMVVHSPFTHWNDLNFGNSDNLKSQIYEACHACLDPVVARAEDQGCMLVIENIEDVDPMERVRLAESFDSDAVKVSIDTGHANCARGASGAPPVDYFVKTAGKQLGHVHLQDTDGYADRHWLPGLGTICWPAVFEALRNYSENPRLVVEVFGSYVADIPVCIARFEEQGLAQ